MRAWSARTRSVAVWWSGGMTRGARASGAPVVAGGSAGTTSVTGPFSFDGWPCPARGARGRAGARTGGRSALHGPGETADDAPLEQREEDERGDHRQGREGEHAGRVHRVLRRERLHAQRERVRRLVVEDEEREHVAVPARDEREDPHGDDA